MKYDQAVRYACARCGFEKFLPEDPADPSQRVRTGCERCGTIRTHKLARKTYGTPP